MQNRYRPVFLGTGTRVQSIAGLRARASASERYAPASLRSNSSRSRCCRVRCGSFAAPLYGENAADASIFTLNLAAGRGALLHCFCAVPEDWQTLELTYAPDFAAGRSVTFTVQRGADEAELGMVPATPAEVGSVVDL